MTGISELYDVFQTPLGKLLELWDAIKELVGYVDFARADNDQLARILAKEAFDWASRWAADLQKFLKQGKAKEASTK